MNKLPIFLLVIWHSLFLFNLKAQNNNDQPYNLKNQLEEAIKYPLSKFNLEPIENIKTPSLRVWRFPGGGASFEQMIELKGSKLNYYSYLLEEIEKKNEYSGVNFVKEINDRRTKKKLRSIINNPNFKNTLDSKNYCDPILSCADLFYIQYTSGNDVIKFVIKHGIEKCDDQRANLSKELMEIIKSYINKY